MFNSASRFQIPELSFQRNSTARFSVIYIYLLNLLFSFLLLTFSSCFILNINILIYILLAVFVFIKFYTNSAGFLFRLVKSNRSLIMLIMEFIHFFQYQSVFNITLPNKTLLFMVLIFLKVKIRKALCCNILSSGYFMKLNYLKSYLWQLIRKI